MLAKVWTMGRCKLGVVALLWAGLPGCLQETEVKEELDTTTPLFPTAIPEQNVTPECTGDIVANQAPEGALETATGWASVDAMEQAGTFGGTEGEVVLAKSFTELVDFVKRVEPLVIQVCGLLEAPDGERVQIASHKTLIGVGRKPTLKASVELDTVHNVIIKNLAIEGADPDGIGVRRSHHVWIDHVDISDAADGNLDITDQSDYVTVSFSRFWYSTSSRAHRFSNLIGSSDNAPEDEGKLRVTLHHNWWADNVVERMPRTRYGDIHVFNNFYSSRDNNYCIRSGKASRLLVEGNYFKRVSDPFEIEGSGQLVERDNFFDSTNGRRVEAGQAFEPPYEYSLDDVDLVPQMVEAQSGVRWSSSAGDDADDE